MVGESDQPEPRGERRRDFRDWDQEMSSFTTEELRGLGRSALDPTEPIPPVPPSDEVLRAQHEDDVQEASELPDWPPDFLL